MDLQNLVQQKIQEKIQEKALSKAAKASNKPTPVSVPAKEILDPSFLGCYTIASMLNDNDSKSIASAVKEGVEETIARQKEFNQEFKQLKSLLNDMEQATQDRDLEGIRGALGKLF